MSEAKVVYVVYIGAPAERVWQALTETEFTRQYFHGTEVRSTWNAGDEVFTTMSNGDPAIRGRVLESDFPRKLLFTWSPQYDPELAKEAASRVTYTLEETKGVTKLTLTHDGFPPASKVYLRVLDGWAPILCSLKTLLETGKVLGVS
jgi:uncharacterized protein YndB with AHSA1/START domain